MMTVSVRYSLIITGFSFQDYSVYKIQYNLSFCFEDRRHIYFFWDAYPRHGRSAVTSSLMSTKRGLV